MTHRHHETAICHVSLRFHTVSSTQKVQPNTTVSVLQPWNAQQTHIDDSFPVSVLSQVISCQPTNFTIKHSPQ